MSVVDWIAITFLFLLIGHITVAGLCVYEDDEWESSVVFFAVLIWPLVWIAVGTGMIHGFCVRLLTAMFKGPKP